MCRVWGVRMEKPAVACPYGRCRPPGGLGMEPQEVSISLRRGSRPGLGRGLGRGAPSGLPPFRVRPMSADGLHLLVVRPGASLLLESVS